MDSINIIISLTGLNPAFKIFTIKVLESLVSKYIKVAFFDQIIFIWMLYVTQYYVVHDELLHVIEKLIKAEVGSYLGYIAVVKFEKHL